MRQSREGRAASRAPQSIIALRRVEVVRTYLALDDPSHLRPRETAPAITGVRIERRAPCPIPLYRRLYAAIGAQWYWHDRLEWSDAELDRYLARSDVGVWELIAEERTAGYFELQRHGDQSVEIVYFGLLPEFIGRGLGAWMLSAAVAAAWDMGARRVWLHTCTLDSDHALPNYTARGFRAFKTERLEVDIDGLQVVGERLIG